MNKNEIETSEILAKNNNCKAVIFDMDGTLLASTEADFLAWQRTFAFYNQPLTFETYYPLLGKKSVDVVQSQLNLHGDDMVEALSKKLIFFEQIVDEFGIETIPFAEDILKSVKGCPVKMALATSSRRPKTTMVLNRLNLAHYFEEIVTGDEVTNGKPAPDIFLKAAERLQVSPADCVVFEDTVSGIASAKSAGMKCVAITTSHTANELNAADLVIDTYESLSFESILEKLYA